MKIDDIARLAKVSKAAVSLALNNKPGVSEETRERILTIVKEHNYIPLRKNKLRSTDAKGGSILFLACKNETVVTEDYQHQPFFNELIGYFSQEIKKTNFSLLISSISTDQIDADIQEIQEQQKPQGIVLLGTNVSKSIIRKIIDTQIPLVVIDTCYPEIPCDFIAINNFQGGYQAGHFLANQGHEKLGYAQSESRIYNFQERFSGFSAALSEKDLSIPNKHIYTFSPTDISVNPTYTREDFIYPNHPTAIFCENDYIAISLIKTLQALGISVPNDISVVGFDNILESNIVTPELTTINVSKESIARLCIEKLLKLVNKGKPEPNTQTFVGTDLVIRNSTI